MAIDTEPHWYRDQQNALIFYEHMKNTQTYKDFVHKNFLHDEPVGDPPSNDTAIQSPKIVMGEHQLRYIYSNLKEIEKETMFLISYEPELYAMLDNTIIELLKVYKQNNIEP